MIARPAVTFRSLVGGVTPNSPAMFASARYRPTVPRYGANARQYLSPSVSRQKPLMKPTSISAAVCRRPGRFRSPCVSQTASRVSTAMMTQLTTADSGTGIPPNSGISNAMWVCSSAFNSALISPKGHHLVCFALRSYCRNLAGSSQAYENKKNKPAQFDGFHEISERDLMNFDQCAMI